MVKIMKACMNNKKDNSSIKRFLTMAAILLFISFTSITTLTACGNRTTGKIVNENKTTDNEDKENTIETTIETTTETTTGETENENRTTKEQTTNIGASDNIRMIKVKGNIYYDTGKQSDSLRCGIMDGTITSQCDAGSQPVYDNQSNFGSGYGYQYAINETIEVHIEEENAWEIFKKR